MSIMKWMIKLFNFFIRDRKGERPPETIVRGVVSSLSKLFDVILIILKNLDSNICVWSIIFILFRVVVDVQAYDSKNPLKVSLYFKSKHFLFDL